MQVLFLILRFSIIHDSAALSLYKRHRHLWLTHAWSWKNIASHVLSHLSSSKGRHENNRRTYWLERNVKAFICTHIKNIKVFVHYNYEAYIPKWIQIQNRVGTLLKYFPVATFLIKKLLYMTITPCGIAQQIHTSYNRQ